MTPKDLKQISNLLDEKLSDIKSDLFTLKFRIEKNEKTINKLGESILKWKSDMFDSAEAFMLETRDEREFRIVSGHQLASNTHRIGELETKVFGKIVGA